MELKYPKECRYYETVLKRKCLAKLKNNVWESKIKWKLLDKADAHWRNKLLCKYFSFWMIRIVERYKKEINIRLANSFYEERLKARGVLALKRNVDNSWMLMRICRKKFERNLKFKLWHQWKHYTQKRLKVKEIKLLANRIREERIRIRYFYLWSFRLSEKRSQVDASRKIIKKYETKLKEKCFSSWKIFTNGKKFKIKIENLAVAYYEDKILERSFLSWKTHFFQKRRYRSHIKIIKSFYENNLMKNYLTDWWALSKKSKHERKLTNYQLARDFYLRKLLAKSFRTLRKAAEARREMCEKTKTFRSLYQNTLIRFYMNVCLTRKTEKVLWNIYETKALKWREDWLRDWAMMKLVEKYKQKVEENEETFKVVQYFNSIVMHRAFRGWTEITIKKVNKKIKAQNACHFYNERMIRKTFKKWKRFVFRKFRKKMANDYYRNTLLLKCINQWRIFVEERKMRIKEAKNLERMHKIKLIKESFACWKNEIKIVKSKTITAVNFYNRSKTSKTFYKWREFTQNKITSKIRCKKNQTIISSISIKSVLFRWNQIYLQRQRVRKKVDKFRIKREKRLARLCFLNWIKFVEKIKKIHEAVWYYPQMKISILMDVYLAVMLEAVELRKIAKRKEELAKRTEEKLLKRKYLKKLESFVCWKKEKILRCMSEERKKETKQSFDFTTGKGMRRKPVIPDYLKGHTRSDDFEDELSVNEETFRVINPTNRKLPVIGHHGDFAFFKT